MKLISVLTIFAIVIPHTINVRLKPTKSENYKINQFEKQLYELLIVKYNHTMFISPLAIRISLGLVYLASEYLTALELSRGLDMGIDIKQTTMNVFKELDTDFRKLPVRFLTRLYLPHRYELKKGFNDLAKKYLQAATAEQVDFNEDSEEYINDWITNNTHALLFDTIKPGKLSGRMVLVSAVYIDCKLKDFKSSYAKFYDDRPHITTMMHGIGMFKYGEIKGLVRVAVEIPINEVGLTLLLMLPYQGETVLNVEEKLKNLNILQVTMDTLKITLVNVTLPEYTGTIDLMLDEEISTLHLQRIQRSVGTFYGLVEPASCPYLTGFVSQTALFLRSGTRKLKKFRTPHLEKGQPKQLRFDRPFLYMIKSKNTIYFKGFITWLQDLDKEHIV